MSNTKNTKMKMVELGKLPSGGLSLGLTLDYWKRRFSICLMFGRMLVILRFWRYKNDY